MIIYYSNTKEDYIEINKFIMKNKIYKFVFDKKELYKCHMTHYFGYARYLAFLYCVIGLLYTYIIYKDFSYVYNYILPSLFTGLAGYLLIDSILAINLNKSLNKLIKQKPYILGKKSITIEDDYLIFSNNSNENIKVNLNDICKIVKNEYNIYIFFNGYKYFQVIPYSAFKDIDERKQFLEILG